jgi:hypothetical protein
MMPTLFKQIIGIQLGNDYNAVDNKKKIAACKKIAEN